MSTQVYTRHICDFCEEAHFDAFRSKNDFLVLPAGWHTVEQEYLSLEVVIDEGGDLCCPTCFARKKFGKITMEATVTFTGKPPYKPAWNDEEEDDYDL